MSTNLPPGVEAYMIPGNQPARESTKKRRRMAGGNKNKDKQGWRTDCPKCGKDSSDSKYYPCCSEECHDNYWSHR